jgi:predicted AlkP superfamily phosphohydrolase/phosphomutase
MNRTVLFGLDGATFAILDPLMRDGTMPHLRAFVEGGVRADLMSTPNPVTPPGWTSMITGRSPGHHGILDFVRAEERRGGMYFTITNSRDVRCETLWSIAGRQGHRVTALNFYGMSPPRPLNGNSIPGFVPGRHLRRSSYPADLFDRLAALGDRLEPRDLGMDLDIEKKCIQGLSPEDYEAWITGHIERERRWFEVLRHLMTTDPCPLTAIVFDGVDKLQHLCWRFIDPALVPSQPNGWERKIRDLCLSYFRQLDGFLAEVTALAGDDARVFIASDHGFGSTTEVVYINVWLQQQGLLSWAEGTPLDDGAGIMVDRLKNHVGLLDWQRTRAYALTPSSNGIFIRGVAPAEYGAFRAHLIDALREFRDPRTGEPIITAVRTREEAFPGPASGQAPDLTLTLRDGGMVSILNAEAPLKPRPEPAGTHRPEGVFVAKGPGIRRSERLAALSILDVSPALLHSLDLDVPADLEGRLPVGAYDPDFLRSRPVRIGAPTRPPDGFPQRTVTEMDAGGEKEIMDRLRALGYIE